MADKIQNKYRYPKDFFIIQIDFARKASLIDVDVNFTEALHEYTHLPNDLFGIKQYPPSNNKLWKEFISLISQNESDEVASDNIYEMYKSSDRSREPETDLEDSKRFGPFSYGYYPDDTTVRLHFRNIKRGGKYSSLSSRYFEENTRYLGEMLQSIHDQNPKARYVVTSSWLGNLDAYTVYFPDELKKSLTEKRGSFTGIWQQFINKDGLIHEERKREFYENLNKANSIEDLYEVFPFKALKGKVKIQLFYEKYGIE